MFLLEFGQCSTALFNMQRV